MLEAKVLSYTFLIQTGIISIPKRRMASSKAGSKTILDLTEAYDESRNKRYKKGKFLGKVL